MKRDADGRTGCTRHRFFHNYERLHFRADEEPEARAMLVPVRGQHFLQWSGELDLLVLDYKDG